MKKGDDGPDPKPAVALAEQTRVYPLWAVEKDVKPMVFPNGSGKRVNMMYPVDNTYWTKLKAFVDYEPVSAIDPELRGVLASIGIIKGQPFNPTDQQQALLKKAVETAPKMIMATRQLGRPDARERYYKDRHYQNTWAGATSEWLQDGYLDVSQRAAYFQIAYSSAPAIVMRTLGAGSKDPFTTQDADGNFLNGSNTHKLHLPPDPPAALFWAVTAHTTSPTERCRKRRNFCRRSTRSTRSRRTATVRSICGSHPRSPRTFPRPIGYKRSAAATSSWRCASTAPVSSSTTRPGSRTTSLRSSDPPTGWLVEALSGFD